MEDPNEQNARDDVTDVAPLADRGATFRRRLALLYLCWGTVLLVIAVRFAVLVAGPADEDGGLWRTELIPSLRGRILDADGRPLAWSTRAFHLEYSKPDSALLTSQDLRELEEACGWRAETMAGILRRSDEPVVTLRRNLDPFKDVLPFQRALLDHPRLKIRMTFVRHHWSGINGRLAVWLGKTRQSGWREVGVSGLEKKLNSDLLTGVDGRNRYMVDGRGNRIPGTDCPIVAPQPGFDRYVDFRRGD